jgi:putative ABC transport system substrate-binding protein
MIGRRTFIVALGSAAALPLVARVQQPAVPVIGWLDLQSPEAARESVPALQQGLAETGYVEGRNVIVETFGQRTISTGCLRLQPISSADGWL